MRKPLRHIERQLKALEAEMAKVKADPAQARAFEILNSIPCITAIAVLAELPEIGSLDPKAAASLAAWRRSRGNPAPVRPRKAAPGALHAGVSAISTWARSIVCNRQAAEGITAVRKLLLLANALIAQDRTWAATPPTCA